MWKAFIVGILGSQLLQVLDDPAVTGWRAAAVVFTSFTMVGLSFFWAIKLAWEAEADRIRAEKMEVIWEKPEPKLVKLTETVTAVRWGYLPGVSDELLQILADGWLKNLPFSEKGYAGLIPGQKFRELQGAFLERGLAEWKHVSHNQGAELTPAGRGLMKRIAGGTLPLLRKFTWVRWALLGEKRRTHEANARDFTSEGEG